VHTAVEEAWLNNYEQAMHDLGYPDSIINRTILNPTNEQLEMLNHIGQKPIPIYLEQRSKKQIGGFTVSGKFDLVMDGVLEDIKNTSAYTYVFKSNDEQYKLQGSIYKWLNPDKITADYMLIQYVFSDWSAKDLRNNPQKYPPLPQLAYKVPLMSIEETEQYVEQKINALNSLWDKPQRDLPMCTDEELWRTPSVWKYYKNPLKTKKSTKNYDNAEDAYSRVAADNYVGQVIEVKGTVKACEYCPAFPICEQKDAYFP
jgi:hypothetical protein